MNKLLFALAMIVCGQAFAQTWSVNTVVGSASITVGASTSMFSSFTAPSAVTVTLDTEIYDSAGNLAQKSLQTGVSMVAGQPLLANAVTYAPPATAVGGVYTVQVGALDSTGVKLFWSASAGTFTVVAPAPVPPVAPPAYVPILPPCLPKIQYPLAEAHGSIPAGVSTRYTMSTAWVCQLPNGYATYASLFTPDQTVLQAIWNYFAGSWNLAQAQADCTQTCIAPTDSEMTYLNVLLAKYRPRALVAFNGANTTRSVYKTNVDGTLNPQSIPGESVAVGTACDETARIPTAPSYYSIAGRQDQAGSPFLPGIYAICVVSLPIGAN